MDRVTALQLADDYFPSGPEHIAAEMGLEVQIKPMSVDGWCVRRINRPALIRLNSSHPETRRRFTLAHELGHLILGTSPDVVGPQGGDLYNPRGAEERAANQLASELLLPLSQLEPLMPPVVDSRSLAKLAADCRVSEVVLVLRIVNNADALRLPGARVFKLSDGVVTWRVPFNDRTSSDVVAALYVEAVTGRVWHRFETMGGVEMVACASNNPTYPLLFVYPCPPTLTGVETPAERRARIEAAFFTAHPEARNSLSGCFGHFKGIMPTTSVEDAVATFFERYADRIAYSYPAIYASPDLEEYVRLRLADWFPSGT